MCVWFTITTISFIEYVRKSAHTISRHRTLFVPRDFSNNDLGQFLWVNEWTLPSNFCVVGNLFEICITKNKFFNSILHFMKLCGWGLLSYDIRCIQIFPGIICVNSYFWGTTILCIGYVNDVGLWRTPYAIFLDNFRTTSAYQIKFGKCH